MESFRCWVGLVLVTAALFMVVSAVAQPMDCHAERSPGGSFEGACVTGGETLSLRR